MEENVKNSLLNSISQDQEILKDPIVAFFSEKIKKILSKNLTALVLFGSRARGDNKIHSDYDFLILVNKKDHETKDKIIDIEVEVLDQFEKLTSSLVWEDKDWELKKKFPIGMNILKEGILL
ncbi:MAG: nucleotidyltransferase domain-containing protein [Leptospiraceae bacterium]|nr:nucleotidyltransferase domain-containing protein [Leptospiraceae bacterium]